MPERRQHRVNEAQEGRSERPAAGTGGSEPRKTFPDSGRIPPISRSGASSYRGDVILRSGASSYRGDVIPESVAYLKPAHIRKLNVCQRSRRSHWPTVRLPTWIRAVPRMPGMNTASVSSSVIRAS
jgi:hypothetical protein